MSVDVAGNFLKHPVKHIYLSLAVAVYEKSVIPRTILNEETTAYIIELCILPSLESDDYQQFLANEDLDNSQDIEYLGEDWIKFRNYAIINSDQVTYLNKIIYF